MNQNFKSAMVAAAKLTAAGDLSAATALIRRTLAGKEPAGTVGEPDVIDVEARWVPDWSQSAGAPTDRSRAAAAVAEPVGEAAAAAEPAAAGAESAAAAAESAATAEPAAAPQPDAAAATAAPRRFEVPDWKALAAGLVSKVTGFRAEAKQPAPATDARQADGGSGQVLAGAFTAPAGSRGYLLYLPAGTAASSSPSLLVMLHGCTQTPADFAAGTAMNVLADREGFLVLYPGQSKGANQSGCWNWFNPGDQRAEGGEPSIIAGMVREVIGRHGVDPGRVYVAGLSAGGAMAAILAEAYPELFAGVAIHSGLPTGAAHDLPSAMSAMKRGIAQATTAGARASGASTRPVRTIVFHGRQDKTVHPANGRQAVDAALAAWNAQTLTVKRESGRSPGGRSFTRTIHLDASGRPMVEQWEVQGAGHAWSGGNASGSFTDPLGPDASAAMVAFFTAR